MTTFQSSGLYPIVADMVVLKWEAFELDVLRIVGLHSAPGEAPEPHISSSTVSFRSFIRPPQPSVVHLHRHNTAL